MQKLGILVGALAAIVIVIVLAITFRPHNSHYDGAAQMLAR